MTCGVGEELREVACYQEGTKVDSRLCDSLTKPDARQRCEQKRCPHWAPGQWESVRVLKNRNVSPPKNVRGASSLFEPFMLLMANSSQNSECYGLTLSLIIDNFLFLKIVKFTSIEDMSC